MAKNLPPNALLDYLIAEKGMKNDAAIARKLDVNTSVLSKIRGMPGYTVSSDVKLSCMRAFGLTLKKIDELVPPEEK